MSRVLTNFPSSFAEAQHALVPRVYGVQPFSVNFLELSNLKAEAGISATQKITEDILLGVLVSTDQGFARVSQNSLNTWGVSLDEVLDRATSNTLGRDLNISQMGEGTFLVRDNTYGASVWLRPELAASLPLQGEPVVVAATDTVTLVTGSHSLQGLTIIATVLEQLLVSGEPVESITPFVWDSTKWNTLPWQVETSAEDTLDSVQHRFAAGIYARQQSALEDFYRKTGQSVFVASYELVRDRNGKMLALGTLNEGHDTVLPLVDEVVFVREGHPPVGASRDRVQALIPDLLVPVGLSPERLRSSGFPREDQLQLLFQ